MGRTNATYRNHLENLMSRFQRFREGLRYENQEHFDSVWEKAFEHAAAAAHMNSSSPGLPALISIMVGQQREISELSEQIDELQERMKDLEVD